MFRNDWWKRIQSWLDSGKTAARRQRRRGAQFRNTIAHEVRLLEPRTLLAAAFPEFVDPHPAPGNQFGAQIVPLSNGNVVITATGDDAGGTDAGAVYLFNGQTGALISALQGGTAGDRIGSRRIIPLPNGNFVVPSPLWDNGPAINAGAVTFVNGTTGLNGVVSGANSLVGTTTDDIVGDTGVTVLSNGNYVVRTPSWDNGAVTDVGAVTWGSKTTGVKGAVSASNSLVGTTSGDVVGTKGVAVLTNGNYVVGTPSWDNGATTDVGAVTWGNGTTGITGAVGPANSLVGTISGDGVGYYDVTALSNGNYVVSSPNWWFPGSNRAGYGYQAGAVTWGNGTTGITGAVSSANSLVGTEPNDQVGYGGVMALSNGNYVVSSRYWANGLAGVAGAVTFGNGTTGISGPVSAANSLVGATSGDSVGQYGATVLSNGNYVVNSPNWDNGAATDAGAVTWGSGTTGTSGVVSAANSLVGTTASDNVGSYGVTALSNGNYAVNSRNWDNGAAIDAGAVTWGNGTAGTSGAVSASNSLIGTQSDDRVGEGGVTALSNGNYVVGSHYWDNGFVTDAGAVTWGSGTTGISGAISAANSLVGSSDSDYVGHHGVTALSNGNYVVNSPYWDNGLKIDAGAVTWGNGSVGIRGVVSDVNSLVGTSDNDRVGSHGVTALLSGNYVVNSNGWDNGAAIDAGAVTWGSGITGISGAVSATNSLVGTTANNKVGYGGVTSLPFGNYVVNSYLWDNGTAIDAGAVTWGNGTTGISGAVSATNSLVGTTANDYVGNGGVNYLSNGNYVVRSPTWDNGLFASAGAMTFGSGTGGVFGAVSNLNSALGMAANTGLQPAVLDNFNETIYAPFVAEGTGRVRVGSQTSGFAVVNNLPVIAGLATSQSVNDNTTLQPFAATTISDPDNQNMLVKVTILNGVARGDFTPASTAGWTRTVTGNNIVYSRYYSPAPNIGAVVQAAVRALVFQPRSNAIKPNTTELTDINLFVNDGVANTTQTTRLTTTSVNDTPALGGLNANIPVNDNAMVNPLVALTVTDADLQEMLASVTILNGVARGDFTNATSSGWTVRYVTGNDITYKRYFSPSPNVGATVQAAFRALTFQPRSNAIKPDTTELTDFQVTVSDGVAPAVLGTGTRVTTTSVNNIPALAGAVANQAINDNQTKTVFSTLTVADPDTQDMLATITITNGVNRGDFTTATSTGWTRAVNGANIVYTRYFPSVTNIGTAVQTAVRSLEFQPRNNVPVGSTETTSFPVTFKDGSAAIATNSTTSVVTTGVAPRPSNTIKPSAILPQILPIVAPAAKRTPVNLFSRILKTRR